MITDASIIKAAQAAVDIFPGVRIFAVHGGKKTPIGPWKENSTADTIIIDHLFAGTNHNVGLHIGDAVAVLDVEGPGKGAEKGAPGAEGLQALITKHGPLPDTITALTPSGGRHYYFRIPHPMTKQADAAGTPNVEFRTGDHYMVLAPSTLDDGSAYTWLDRRAPGDIELAELPDAWVKALDAYSPPVSHRQRAVGAGDDGVNKLDCLLNEARTKKLEKLNPPTLEPILAGCAWLRHLKDYPEQQSEPDWYAAAAIIGRCEDGERLFLAFSEGYPENDPSETQAKLQHALEASGPRTCADINSEYCRGCPYAHKGGSFSPISLGRTPENIVSVCNEVIYIQEMGAMMRIADRSITPLNRYIDATRHRVKGQTRTRLLESKALLQVPRIDYLAGDDRLVVDGAANRWMKRGIEPREGDPSLFVDFVKWLIPDVPSHEHVFDYLAHTVQRPSTKILHGLMVTGPQGVGKSMFMQIVEMIIGSPNFRTVPGKILESRWQADLVDCQFLCFEEAASHGKWEAGDRMKEFMTSDTFTVEEKGLPAWRGRTPRGVVILTNHPAGVSIDYDDRRWHLSAAAQVAKEAGYYAELGEAIADGSVVAAFLHWLMARDISKFNPKAKPPTTLAKKEGQKATATPVAQVLHYMLDDEDGALKHDIYTFEEIMNAINTHGGLFDVGPLLPNRVTTALKAIGGVPLAGRPRIGPAKKRPRVWAIRNHELYRNMGDAQLAAALEGRGAPSFMSAGHLAREALGNVVRLEKGA